MSKSFFKAAFVSLLSIGAFSGVAFSSHYQEKDVANAVVSVSQSEIDDYYSSISSKLTGNELLKALRALNSSKRKSTVGYNGFRQFAAKCDINPDDHKKIVGFYNNAALGPSWDSGKTWNREHMWPKSRNGSAVEADAHMVRPASTAINSERGNKFFGLDSGTYDPGQYVANYRGISARIIFYCAIADGGLSLVDKVDDDSSNGTMGKLSTLLKWNLDYAPGSSTLELRTEQNRNNVIQKDTAGQGNRNPFIDHPEYACKIWGNTNDATKAICQGHMGDEDQASIRSVGTFTKTTYNVGDSLDPSGVTIIYNSGKQGEADVDVTSQVTWEPTKFLGAGNITVLAKYGDYVTSCGTVTVEGESIITSPQVNTRYHLGFQNNRLQKQLYVDGTAGSYSLNTTTEKTGAANVYLEAATDGYYIKIQKPNTTATYLESYVSGTYTNLRLSSSPVTIWKFDSTHNTFTTDINGSSYFIGSYNDYTDLRISSTIHIDKDNNFPAHLYETDNPIPIITEKLEIYGELEKDEYYVGETFDPTGLTVVHIDEKGEHDVTSEVSWNLGTFTTPGAFTLTATYNALSATYIDQIQVMENIPEEDLVISGSFKKTTYVLGEWLDPTGITINYICDGEIKNVTNSVRFDPMKFEYTGEVIVNAHYSSEYSDLVVYCGMVTVVDSGSSSETSEYTSESTSYSSEEISTSTSQQGTSSNSDSSGDKPSGQGGGCSASIRGNSSIVFILGFVGLFFAIRHLIKLKKEDK